MPEQIRLKVGGVTPQQMAVYEEFSRNIPGFIPMGGSLSGELPAGTTADSTTSTSHSAASYMVKPLPVIALYSLYWKILIIDYRLLLFHLAHSFAVVVNRVLTAFLVYQVISGIFSLNEYDDDDDDDDDNIFIVSDV